MVLGIIGIRAVDVWIDPDVLPSSLKGFLLGLSSVLLGVSIVFNLKGITEHRRQR